MTEPAVVDLSTPDIASPVPDGLVDAVLEGGPAYLPSELRLVRVASAEKKIKVCCYGGYEHFERDPSPASAGQAVVFRWTDRTRIAE